MAWCGQPPIEHDVSVEQRARTVYQRILFIVSFHQDCVAVMLPF
jgi:hypothetical protein